MTLEDGANHPRLSLCIEDEKYKIKYNLWRRFKAAHLQEYRVNSEIVANDQLKRLAQTLGYTWKILEAQRR